MKKILICDDSEGIASCVKEMFTSPSYELYVLTQEKSPKYILKNIFKTIKDNPPDYLIIDGLEGLCFKAINLAEKAKPDIKIVICSGSDKIITKAKEKNYKAFGGLTRFLNMFYFINDSI